MNIQEALFNKAEEIAKRLGQKIAEFEREQRDLESRLAQIKIALGSLNMRHDRLGRFLPEIGPNYQCPNCWIENEARSTLVPVPSDTDDDVLRCKTCHFEIILEQ